MRQVREHILDTASRLFYEHGLRAVGVDRIIAEAGIAKASLYKHFPSKDALIAAYLSRRSEHSLTRFEASLLECGSRADAGPLDVFDALEQWFADPGFRGCAFINTIVELADPAHGAHRISDQHKRSVVSMIERRLREHGSAHPAALARQFVMLMDGAIVTALREGRPDAARDARRIAESLLRDSMVPGSRSD